MVLFIERCGDTNGDTAQFILRGLEHLLAKLGDPAQFASGQELGDHGTSAGTHKHDLFFRRIVFIGYGLDFRSDITDNQGLAVADKHIHAPIFLYRHAHVNLFR